MALLADVRRRRDRRGWLPCRADTFERLDKIGQGTYSNVYKARDLQSGKIVALKRVRFVNMDPESVRFMARDCGRSTCSGGWTTPTT
jgi:serine/threonine protein kinase